ncbi:alpha/beta hydrolase [Streptomyces sp. G3]|uniref:alpha/beta fold hydrolase n=2 Tax=Streptomyces TaxID=1883 RepID=UPI001F348E2B|nr:MULTISPECIES: alpha/beta hydrolase [unclassified Streptomyces]MCM1936872.1 alpha/beta hydrolase [Streptomyces sp. G3]WKX17875.1 alpha/beta hydrolase [Streptomyces sp. HUAS CX7]
MTPPGPPSEPTHDAAPVPAHAVLGPAGSPRHAIVLAPVLARWDHGAFFRRIAGPFLDSGHRVTIHDTLSLLRDGDDLGSLVHRWARYLAPGKDPGPAPGAPGQSRHAPPDVLVGNALGGAVVQGMLGEEWTHRAKVLLLSGPTVADHRLNTTLERIAATADAEGLPAATRLLEDVVRGPDGPAGAAHRRPTAPDAPAPTASARPTAADEPAARRLAAGLRLLHDADARHPVRDFPGPLLHVYGERSRLVGREHLATGPLPHHRLVAVPRAGMRPHADRPDLVRHTLTRFLGAELT